MEGKADYVFMWGQRQSAMVAESMLRIFSDYPGEFSMTEGVDDVFREHAGGFSYIYFSRESLSKASKNGEKYLDDGKAREIFRRMRSTKAKAMAFYRRVRRMDPERLSDRQIASVLKEYQSHMTWMNRVYRTSDPSSTGALEREVRKALSEKYSPDELERKFGILMTSAKMDRSQRELIAWQKAASLKKKVSDASLIRHALRFPEKFSNAWSYGEIVDFLRERMRQTDPKTLNGEIREIRKFKAENKRKQDAIFREMKAGGKFKKRCLMLQELGLSRFDLKEAWGGAETLILGFLNPLAQRLGMDMPTFMASYNFTDLIGYFENGTKLSKSEIKYRMEYSIIHFKRGRLIYLYGDEAKSYCKKIYAPQDGISELRGTSANPGKVTGPVKIVRVDDLKRLTDDMKTFRKGDIIVTTMTSPLIIPIAVKAAAIVTNQGGICSHAAVISREFNIPCIVGTHDATRIFKDGDKVEVDADKGIVRRIIQ